MAAAVTAASPRRRRQHKATDLTMRALALRRRLRRPSRRLHDGPDYGGPPSTRRKVPVRVAGAIEPRNAAWWKQFQDPVLDALVAEALANNDNIKIAVANLEQAAGVFTQTRSPLFPQVGYGGSGGTRAHGGSRLDAGNRQPHSQSADAYQALLNVSWEIDLWGRIRRLTEAARANVLATDEARRGVILSLVAAVTTNYLQLRGLDEQLVIANQTLDTYGESVRLFNLQFKYGQISQMNVAQVQSQYETAAAQIPQIESQIAQTENALSVLLGRNPGPDRARQDDL